MEKYFIHSNELHLIDVDKIHQAVERIVDSLDMAVQKEIFIQDRDIICSLSKRCNGKRRDMASASVYGYVSITGWNIISLGSTKIPFYCSTQHGKSGARTL